MQLDSSSTSFASPISFSDQLPPNNIDLSMTPAEISALFNEDLSTMFGPSLSDYNVQQDGLPQMNDWSMRQ
jgi:hypothetical protein